MLFLKKNQNLNRIVVPLAFFFFIGSHSVCAAEKLPVSVSILPQKYFVQKIGGDLVEVSVLVEPGASPETYEPKPKQMVTLAKAKIYFAIGVPFEKKWLPKIVSLNPNMLLVRTDTGIAKIPMTAHQHPVKKCEGSLIFAIL